MSNTAENPFVLLAQRYLEAAQAAKNPRFEDFTRAHQSEWAARQALVGDPVALSEAIVALAQQQPTPEQRERKHGNSGPRYTPSESFKADVAAAFQQANADRVQLAALREALEALAGQWESRARGSVAATLLPKGTYDITADAYYRCAQGLRAALAGGEG